MQIVYIFILPQILKAHNFQNIMLGILGIQSILITQITPKSIMSNKKCIADMLNRGKRLLDGKRGICDSS